MRISPEARAGAAALALGVAILASFAPAIGQDRPESILPPGFGDPAPPPSPRPTPTREGLPPSIVPGQPSTAVVQPLPQVGPTPDATPSETPSASPTPVDPRLLAEYEMPASARRSLTLIGAAGERETGIAADAFGSADGGYVEALMRRVAAPLPSRWLSILLRRTLVAGLDTPRGLDGADFAAERAWLLLRMGEADSARAIVQGVDNANYTPKLYQVAMNAMLANGDPGGLCPLADAGRAATGERGWIMAQAMCAGLTGDAAHAKALIAAARRRRIASGIDLQLAQKVVGAGPNGGQAMTIEWAGVDMLTAWRFGLAAATGVAIPDDMMATAGPQVSYWRALSATVPLTDRVASAEAAAGQGVLSNLALVDLYAAIDADETATGPANAVALDLRNAYVGTTVDARMQALRSLWGDSAKPAPYSRLVLTARAAARLPTKADQADADRLVAAMLSGGLDRTAARWRDVVAPGSDAWAMIRLSDPDMQRRLSYSELSSYSGGGDVALKRRLFFAGLAGLGRLAPEDVERAAESLDVRIGMENSWTRALDRAAADNQPATVVLLAAIGMQTSAWRGVPPDMLYRIVGALRTVGLGGEARMIAAEAIARA